MGKQRVGSADENKPGAADGANRSPSASAGAAPSISPSEAETSSTSRAPGAPVTVVGIGASAGGLDAFTQLLTHLPPDSGMAFVLIQHLDPAHKSFLGEALCKATQMPVTQAVNGELPQPNHVYVIPPDADISIEGGMLTLVPRPSDTGKSHLHLPIDSFFQALAMERRNGAVGVVLSGTASDGTEGLRAIKAQGGITFAQTPATAKFAGMPQSAVDAGVVDHVLPVSALARELVRLSSHPYLSAAADPEGEGPSSMDSADSADSGRSVDLLPPASSAGWGRADSGNNAVVMTQIMNVVKTVVGVDFSEYKSPTFERRLARRLALRGIETLGAYLSLLEGDPAEVRALYEDTLIHVSSFFRDPDAFATLKRLVFPEILKHKDEAAPIRIWVGGCSTGEEVYSLAIALLEFLGDSPNPHPVQIFGSDVSQQSIQSARAGKYLESAMVGVSEEQRRRYFTKVEAGFRISKSVRDLCVFVRHDLARDPPFSRLDLMSCRNVLIYFDQPLQKRLIPTFHHSLNEPGFLLLGRSEYISGFANLFYPVDKASKIFARSAGPSNVRYETRPEMHPTHPYPAALGGTAFPRRAADIGGHLDRLLLERYAPPGVLVNERMEILQFRGQTGAYLEPAPGEPQHNLIKMARGGLLGTLQMILARAKTEMAPVRANGVEVDQDGFTRTCDIVVVPFIGLPETDEPLFVVLFEEVRPSTEGSPVTSEDLSPPESSSEKNASKVPKLTHELAATKQYLHALIEEHGRTNDELGSANEELVSGNEELQSLNEELETAKEELQSTNEELTTVNDELSHRNLEMSQINSDLANLLDTVDTAVVILDKGRHIRRFTPKAQALLNLLPSDVGRLFDDIKPRIEVGDLDQQITEVITTFVSRESDVQDREGRWYRMQIRPYKKSDDLIDGAIVSLFDIDALKHHLRAAELAKDEAERADRAKDEFLAVLSHELRTPLSALLMQAQLLRMGSTDATKRDRACDAIERSTKMLVKLIDDLLDVSRIVTGKMRVDLQPLDLATIVDSTLEGVAMQAERKSVHLISVLDRSLAPIAGDRMRLEQVISNLLTNAIKFTPAGGTVEVLVNNEMGNAHLQVRDTGMGIDPEFLPRVFNRLTQEDSSITRAHSGLGLGLAIVRHLVDAHGGVVRAESPGSGQGATFHATFPLLRSDWATSANRKAAGTAQNSRGVDATAAPRAGLANRKILIVEDDVSIRDALAEMLMQTGATVQTAESAIAAMRLFEGFRPDLLICDIAMPGEDGYAFIRKIRALGAGKGKETPALALTALAGDGENRRAMADGFQKFMVKPVDAIALQTAVAELLNAPRGGAAASRSRLTQ
jgi:two-component system CheB/CheR fusion protein